jgi:uncharacterized membrane protein YqhA
VRSSQERWERVLWGSRVAVLIAVGGSVVLSVGAFLLGAADTVSTVGSLVSYLLPFSPSAAAEHDALRGELMSKMVKGIDAYLVGAILLVVALGLYELFIGRIRVAEDSELQSRVITIRTLDDLKDRMSRLVLLILIVEFFGIALQLSITNTLDLLELALGILLIAGAMFLGSWHGPGGEPNQ